MRKLYAIMILLIIIILNNGYCVSAASSTFKPSKSVEAKVIELIPNTDSTEKNTINNKVKIEITSGRHKGQILTVDNLIDTAAKDKNAIDSFNVHKGNKVLLYIEEDDKGNIKNSYVYDFVRYKNLALIASVFIFLLIIIGGKKGLKSLLSLLFTGIAITKVLIPIILKGINPVIPTILICITLLIINFLIVSGFNKKSVGAILGTTIGLSISGGFFLISGNILRITGISGEDAQTLTSIVVGPNINFKGIFFTCVMLGALGAIMDVGITISSTMYEMKSNNPNISEKELFKSGMNVGKDIMGTMSNTLILAYAGSAMILLLILSSYDMTFLEILNQNIVASEILKALIGSIGIILTIPATAFIMAKLKLEKHQNKI